MRNLALISSWDSFLPSSSSSSITATTIDLDENVIYVASEHSTLDGQVEVGVWKMDQSEGSNWVIVHRDIPPVSISKYSQVSSGADIHFSNDSFLEWAKQ
jgi:elongator complex protein 1